MSFFLGEMIGTALLILLGNGIVANAVLQDTKGHAAGWLAITFGWAVGVFVGVFTVASYSGAHINPAVTVGLAIAGKFDWALVPIYILAQLLGAMIGSGLVFLHYRTHYARTEDADLKLATFSTGPAIRSTWDNFFSEILGTFVLVFAVLYLVTPTVGDQNASLGALDALPVALLVLGIGLSLGGTTGYAINPARDLGPRIMHALLPIPGKGSSDWSYAWIPVVGPILGAALASGVFLALG